MTKPTKLEVIVIAVVLLITAPWWIPLAYVVGYFASVMALFLSPFALVGLVAYWVTGGK